MPTWFIAILASAGTGVVTLIVTLAITGAKRTHVAPVAQEVVQEREGTVAWHGTVERIAEGVYERKALATRETARAEIDAAVRTALDHAVKHEDGDLAQRFAKLREDLVALIEEHESRKLVILERIAAAVGVSTDPDATPLPRSTPPPRASRPSDPRRRTRG